METPGLDTMGCPDCEGFGYLDDEGDEECGRCQGYGTIEIEEE